MTHHETDRLHAWRDKGGKLIAYAWPGGYPVEYIDPEGSALCPECANKSDSDPDEIPQFKPIAGSIYYEGPTIQCDQCGKPIESAYGDPENNS